MNTDAPRGHIFGLGDLTSEFYLAPSSLKTISAGIGAALAIPTAKYAQLGTGKVSVGPALVFAAMPSNWVFGFRAYNVFSFAGNLDRPSVNQLNIYTFIYYDFSNRWFLTSTPSIFSNWNVKGSNKWVVPIGGGAGRAFKVNNQVIFLNLQSFYNILVPTSIGTKWTVRFSLEFFFPEANL
ncbi:MAG: hypothetical protein K2P93_05780 [Alphaproteobacteria bacterium]|nr:hypothetical protein [Alphaproteobacteria bacterium]